MSGIEISITIGPELDAMLARAIAGADDLSQPMAEISEVLVEGAHRNFAAEADPMGVPWKKSAAAIEEGRKTLHKSGLLENAIVPEYGPDFAMAGVLRTAGPAIYARIHQDGGEIRPREKKALSFGGRLFARVVMPRRQYLGGGPFVEGETVDILGDYFRTLFSRRAPA